jgi:hypothetical protein
VPTPRKLPFWRTVWRTYRTTFGSLGYFFRISWLWLIITVPILTLNSVLFSRLQTQGVISEQVSNLFMEILVILISLPSFSSIGVTWLRWILSGELVTAKIYLRLDRSMLRFMPFSLLVSSDLLGVDIVAALPWSWFEAAWYAEIYGIAFSMVLPPIAIVLVMFGVCARFAAVLPAKALGMNGVTLADAWHAARDNTWRLMLGIILCNLPILVPVLVAAGFGFDPYPSADPFSPKELAIHAISTLVNYGIWLPSLTFVGFYGHYLLQLTTPEDTTAKAGMSGLRHASAHG